MKAIKIMSIIGIILAPTSYIFISIFATPVDYDASAGWGIIATAYLLAFSIVALIKANKK